MLLLAWTWRYRQELWHRARALALLGLVLLVTALAYKLTAGRSILPFFVPGAGASMLVAILLGAGPATMITAMLAILAGAVNGLSLELAAYVFVGGHDRDHRRPARRPGGDLPPGRAWRSSSPTSSSVTIFSLLGTRDLTGILQLWGASLAAGVGSAIAPWARSRSWATSSGSSPSSSSSSWPTRPSRSCAGSSSRRPARTTTR